MAKEDGEYISIRAYFNINGIKVSPNAFKKDSEIETGIKFMSWNDSYYKDMFLNPEEYIGFFIPSWQSIGIPKDREGKIKVVTIHKKHE